MSNLWKSRFGLGLGTGLAVGLLVGVGMMVGAVYSLQRDSAPQFRLPETLLHATATHGGSSIAAATGFIDEEAEGLFTLDYLTGELQCRVMNVRLGKIAGLFNYNVIADLGVDRTKKPDYVLVTGQATFPRGGAVARPSLTVAYVVDGNTGNFGCYVVPWVQNAAAQGAPQTGAMILLDKGTVRQNIIRQ